MPTLEDLSLNTTGPALWPANPGQCLLSGFSGAAMHVGGMEGFPIWLDNLYIREGDPDGTAFIVVISKWGKDFRTEAPNAWMTRLTIQGNGHSERVGMGLSSPSSYLEGDMLLIPLLLIRHHTWDCV